MVKCDQLIFGIEYKINLRYPQLPLVDVGGQKSNLLPAELCTILPNQAFKGKLTDENTAAMITHAAKPPNVNATAIAGRGLDELGFRPGGSAELNTFGVSVGNEMTVVPARILPPPGIRYGQGTPSVDERASWNLRNVKFAKGTRLAQWAVLVIKDGNERDEFQAPNDPELMGTLKGFGDMCKNSGMAVDGPPLVAFVAVPRKSSADPTRSGAAQAVRDALRKFQKKPSVVMVILSNGDKHIYNGIKHVCDTQLDVGKLAFGSCFKCFGH